MRVLVSQLHSEVEKPLLTFRSDHFKKDLKKYDHHMADLRKQLASRYAGVEKVRARGGAAACCAAHFLPPGFCFLLLAKIKQQCC